MTQSQLNRAIARATGEAFAIIDRHGFSLVEEEPSGLDDALDAQVVDWDLVQAEQATALFRDRQQINGA